jgi:hypothetical protein
LTIGVSGYPFSSVPSLRHRGLKASLSIKY